MFLTNFITGKAKLWQAWWLVLTLGAIILKVAAYSLVYLSYNYIVSVLVILLLMQGIYIIFAPYIVWKCSGNSNSPGWTSIARILIVIGIIFEAFGNNFQRNINALVLSLVGLAILSASLIIAFYLTAKINKNKKLIAFNDKYAIPVLLVIGYSCTFLERIF